MAERGIGELLCHCVVPSEGSRKLVVTVLMKLLIVGARSKTVEAVLRLLRRRRSSWEVLLLSHRWAEPMNIHGYPVHVIPAYDRQPLRNACLSWEPEVILNAAALTDVDACEQERNLAWRVNVGIVEVLAGVCRILGSHLLQLSSDYVFDGNAGPYPETARPSPLNYYGRTKLAAENLCLAAAPSVTILRTTQIYGTPAPWAEDVLRWALARVRRGEHIPAAVDVFTNPIFVDDLARALLCAAEHREEGIFHVAGDMWLSRYEFLRRAFQAAGLDASVLIPLPAEELYRGRAPRPLRSGLCCERARQRWRFVPTPFEEALPLALYRNQAAGSSGEITL